MEQWRWSVPRAFVDPSTACSGTHPSDMVGIVLGDISRRGVLAPNQRADDRFTKKLLICNTQFEWRAFALQKPPRAAANTNPGITERPKRPWLGCGTVLQTADP